MLMISWLLASKASVLIKHDHHCIDELMTVCLEGCRFYETAARKTKNTELRLLFREMAVVKAAVAKDISQQFSHLNVDKPCQSKLVRTVGSIYRLLNDHFIETLASNLLADLAVTEMRSLAIFKIYVRRMSDRNMACYVAGHLASIQLSQDRMKQLDSIDYSTSSHSVVLPS